MPHIQPKVKAAKSPFDVNGVLEALQNINLIGIGGSGHETGGHVAIMVEDGDLAAVRDALAAYPDYREFGEPDDLHLDYVEDVPGGLLAAVKRGRAHHEGGIVKDITVGVRPIAFWVDGNGDLVRDGNGNPVEDGNSGGDRIDAFPVQIFFLVPGKRGTDGELLP